MIGKYWKSAKGSGNGKCLFATNRNIPSGDALIYLYSPERMYLSNAEERIIMGRPVQTKQK
jgi:hypothetical protein